MDDYNFHVSKYRHDEELQHYDQQRQQRRRGYDDDYFPFGFGYGGERRNNGPDPPIINPDQFFYQLQLIPDELIMQIYDQGIGIHPLPGQFITIRQKIYLQGQQQVQIKKGISSYLYGRRRIIPGLELAFAMVKQRMRVRLKIASKLGYGQLRTGTIPANSTLMVDFTVNSIDDFPRDDDEKQLQHIYCEIVNLSSQGDKQFQRSNFTQCLRYYESAQQKIMNEEFSRAIRDKKIPSYRKQASEADLQLVATVQQQVQKISLKALQIALINQEYYKVIKWGYHILINPRYDKNQRGLMARARAFIEVHQYDLAMKDLKLAKMCHPQYEPIQTQILYLQRKKKQYQLQKQKYSFIGKIEQEDYKKLNQKKEPKYDNFYYF